MFILTGVVLQDAVAATDTVYFAFYTPICEGFNTTYNDTKDCFIVRRYDSYQDLKNYNSEYPMYPSVDNETYMTVRCYLPSVRIMNGTLYCRKYSKYNANPISEYLVKADAHTGAVIYETYLSGSRKSNDDYPHCCDSRVQLFVDETGLWLMHDGRGRSAVLQLIDPHSLKVLYQMRMPWQMSINDHYFMQCGKLFQVTSSGIKEYDIKSGQIVQTHTGNIDPLITQDDGWFHYNPRLRQFFLGRAGNRNYRLNLQ